MKKILGTKKELENQPAKKTEIVCSIFMCFVMKSTKHLIYNICFYVFLDLYLYLHFVQLLIHK